MSENADISYLEWQALVILYRNRERRSSPAHYVGLDTTIMRLINRRPPLVEWVGKPSQNQGHITSAGSALWEQGS